MRRLIVIAALIAACSENASRPDFTLRIAVTTPLLHVEPQLKYGGGMIVKGLVFQLLLEPTLEGTWRSSVLSDWAQTSVNRFRVRLNSSAMFSDGSPVTKEELSVSLAESHIRVQELEDSWLEISPEDNQTPIETLLLHAVIFKNKPDGPLGTGPFSLISQEPNVIRLRRVRKIANQVSELEVVGVATSRDAFSQALRGSVNVLLMPDPGEIELLRGVPQFRLIRGAGIHAVSVLMNARRLNNVERRALVEALPIAEIAKAYGDHCQPRSTKSFIHPGVEGRSLEIIIPQTDPALKRAALALRRSLGNHASLTETGTLSEQIDRVQKGKFDLALATLQIWPPRAVAWRWSSASGVNLAGYHNPSFDEAIRARDFKRANWILEEDPPAISICTLERTAAIDSRIENPELGTYDILERLPDWTIAK